MASDLHSIYQASEGCAKIAAFGLCALILAAILGTIFSSPTLVVGIVVGTALLVMTFMRPTWGLYFLSAYLPLEPFLLKWTSDEVYIFARYGAEVLMYALVVAVVWRMVTGTIRLRHTPLDVAFVLFVVLALASAAINAVAPLAFLFGMRQLLRFVLLFFVAAYLDPGKTFLVRIVKILCVIAALQIILGFAQAAFGGSIDAFLLPSERRTLGGIQLTAGTNEFWDPGQRVFGTLGRYDQLGTFLAFVLLFVVAFMYERRHEAARIRYSILLFSGLTVLVLTYSRSAWFGFLFGFLFLGIVLKRDKRVLAAAVFIPLALAAYVGVTGLVVSQIVESPEQTLAQRLFESFSYDRVLAEYYGIGRVYWIVQTLNVVVPASPVFGFGPGTYGGGAAAALRTTGVYDALGLPFGVYGTEGYIDNNWLSIWGETGTLGLAAFVWMFAGALGACAYVARHTKDADTRALALGTSAALVALALNAFLATYFETRTLAPYVWLMAGGVVALGQRERIL